ncbi:hypothetical protein AV530_003588 [Patagioenas fasciata monilis]|uniref:Uncharacterized protein n=1 Tax=Patagioenas fasciata monilis TaxID=372326 RepID=A0A1V4KXY0_PATFA|nr:hypothetical protein AV530_003588 [Patagioenas fasciata monilis]
MPFETKAICSKRLEKIPACPRSSAASDSLPGVTSCFERWGDIEVTAQHHELLRTPSWGNITQAPGQSPASKRWCEKSRSRTGAMGHPEKEEKVSE